MLQAFISVSDELDLLEATQEVITDCRVKLDGLMPKVGIVFTSCMGGDFSGMLAKILGAFPGIQLLGCTTDGEISRAGGFMEDSVALLLLCSSSIRFGVSVAVDVSKQPEASIAKAFAECRRKISGTPRCGFIFPDGITTVGGRFRGCNPQCVR